MNTQIQNLVCYQLHHGAVEGGKGNSPPSAGQPGFSLIAEVERALPPSSGGCRILAGQAEHAGLRGRKGKRARRSRST